jgi:hypothetical protein
VWRANWFKKRDEEPPSPEEHLRILAVAMSAFHWDGSGTIITGKFALLSRRERHSLWRRNAIGRAYLSTAVMIS